MNFFKMHSERAKKNEILKVVGSKYLTLLKKKVAVHFTQFASIL